MPKGAAARAAQADAGSLMPEPGQMTGLASAGGADDLIAQLADQQIDQLMADEQVEEIPFDHDAANGASPEAAVEVAQAATEELAEITDALSEAAAADIQHDLEQAALLAPMPETTPEQPAHEPAEQAVAAEASDADVAATEVAADPLVVHKAETAALLRDVSHPPADEPAHVTGDAPPTSPETTELPLSQTLPASFSPPARPASTPAAHDGLTTVAPAEDAASADEAPGALQSSAAAVAQELADDSRLFSARSSAVEDVAHSMPADVVEARGTFAALRDGVLAVPVGILWVINLPARGLSDTTREMIGVAAIVTLVNAMALLLYLMLFT